MIFNEPIYRLVPTSHSHNHLLVLSLDEYPLLSIGVHSLLFSNKEQACLVVYLVVVDVFREFLIGRVILDWLVYKVHALQVIHVLVYPLQFMLAFPDLIKHFLMLLHDAVELVLAFFIAALHDVELVHQVLVFEVLLAHLVL